MIYIFCAFGSNIGLRFFSVSVIHQQGDMLDKYILVKDNSYEDLRQNETVSATRYPDIQFVG